MFCVRIWLRLNRKKPMESLKTRLMSWYWKRKPTWRKDLITYSSHPWVMFSFTWMTIIWREGYGDSFEIGRQRSRGWKNFGRGGQERWGRGVLKIGHFLGRHMFIVPKRNYHCLQKAQISWLGSLDCCIHVSRYYSMCMLLASTLKSLTTMKLQYHIWKSNIKALTYAI